jgi:hypothetical protein
MNSYGLIGQILDRIKAAKTPPRFTQDFLDSKLGFSGGSAKAFIPLIKRLGLVGSDGVPSELYHKFRNPSSSKQAIADAMRNGYSDLYARNEYAHELSEDQLRGLVMEATGLDDEAGTLRAITKSFMELRRFADFETSEASADDNQAVSVIETTTSAPENGYAPTNSVGIGLSYTINLNLPETTDIAVFNAIFRSLKENLLRRS